MDDLIGRTFSRLTVVARTVNFNHSVRYECLCVCGKTVIAYKSMLVSGKHKSCGCLKRERIIEQSTTHGLHNHELYNTWKNMWQRCTNPNNPKYPRWGGRGIEVHERWRSFENFIADVGDRPPGKTLDRRDNDGDYGPDNWRWATPAEQAANTRNLKLTPEVIAEIQVLHELGMTMKAIGQQLDLNRHTVAKALF